MTKAQEYRRQTTPAYGSAMLEMRRRQVSINHKTKGTNTLKHAALRVDRLLANIRAPL